MVVEDAPTLLAQLNADIHAEKTSDAAATGHSLKGLLSTFETGQPVSELQPLIDAARRGNTAEVAALLREIKPSLEKLIDEIRSITGSV
ncbi:MAG: Hpt domain-containing protein [Rubripirellula sp.]